MSGLQGTPPTGKNIIICCDGTNNQLDGEFSNVAKLYSVLEKIPGRQVVYYDPGVGTLGDPRFALRTTQALSRHLGLAFGYGFKENISEAYAFLMDTYEEGDRVFLFGFSRGAFTVRALAGVLHTCGLVEKRNQNLLPYLFRIHMKSWDRPKAAERDAAPAAPPMQDDDGRVYGEEAAKRFKEIYARTVNPHFLGIFDTVTSLGWVYRRTRYPYSTWNPDVRTVRHAVSIDERRAQYRQNLWRASPGQDVRQVWFSGVHSDIGGGYPEKDSGLAKIPLAWMVAEAHAAGLLVDLARYRQIVLGQNQQPGRTPYVAPDPAAKLHRSLSGPWWLLEYLPMRGAREGSRLRMPQARYRDIRGKAFIHQSVLDRVRAVPGYRPPELFDKDGNIRPALRIEPYPASPFY
jgi:uncharacterized protein (DUF2235 family)